MSRSPWAGLLRQRSVTTLSAIFRSGSGGFVSFFRRSHRSFERWSNKNPQIFGSTPSDCINLRRRSTKSFGRTLVMTFARRIRRQDPPC